jgi:hypothetical protein
VRISIWQQFSSNHSAGFFIVATFESAETAKQVEAKIRDILIATALWEEDSEKSGRWSYETPADLEIAETYRIDFHTHIDWLFGLQHARHAVQTIDKAVFLVDAPGYSNGPGATPFVELLQMWGADVITEEERYPHGAYYMLSCIAPDDETVMTIMSDVKTRTMSKNIYIDKVSRIGFKEIRHQERQITISDGYLTSDDFFGLVAYLKDKQCRNLRAQFRATDDTFHGVGRNFRSTYVEKWIELDALDVKQAFWLKFPDLATFARNAQAVVADFPTPDLARKAYAVVLHMLRSIADWAGANPNEAQFIRAAFWERLSPPEQRFKEKYNVPWHYSLLEWMLDLRDLTRVEETVGILDNFLLLANPSNNLIGIEPFPSILRSLGAWLTTIIPSEHKPLFVHITCKAPNQAVAQELYDALMGSTSDEFVAWFPYWGGQFQALSEETLAGIRQVNAYETYLNALWEDDIERVPGTHLIPIQQTEYEPIWWRIYAVQFEFESIYLARDEQTLHLRAVDFSKCSLSQALPALIAWLRAQDCQVEYAFSQEAES